MIPSVPPLRAAARRRPALALCALGLAAMAMPARTADSKIASPAGPPAAARPTAEQSFRNIQVLKGMPSEQMYQVMYLMSRSLGVSCVFCHAAENEKFELDIKEEKQTARQMIRMMSEINRTYFAGHTEITCNSCHHGQARPAAVPPLGQGAAGDPGRGLPAARSGLPSAAQLLDRYLASSGGRDRLAAVTRRVSRGRVQHSKTVELGTPRMRRINRGQEDPIELVQWGANQLTITIGPPEARIVERFDSKTGTVETPQGKRRMTPLQALHVSEVAELHPELRLLELAGRMQVVGREQIGDRDVYVVRAPTADGRSQTLYFDAETSLLSRRVVFTPTVLGLDPEQLDYSDYRDAGGLRLPFVVKATYLNDDDLGSTLHWAEIQNESGEGRWLW